MSWLSDMMNDPAGTTVSTLQHWGGEYKKNIELPWKSGYDKGTKGFGPMGNPVFGIVGGTLRVATDWYFQNTGPYKDEEPAWSDAPGADDYLSSEQYKDKYGHYKGEASTGDADAEIDENGNGDGDGDGDNDATGGNTDTPAASAALAALMRRRLKMRRGRSATVLTKGAKIGKGDKKQMAYA